MVLHSLFTLCKDRLLLEEMLSDALDQLGPDLERDSTPTTPNHEILILFLLRLKSY